MGRSISTDGAAADRRKEEEEREERLGLARLEAERAARVQKDVRARGAEPPTPEEGIFAHLPTPCRQPMAKVSEWIRKEETHVALSKFMSIDLNIQLEELVDT